MGVPLQIQPMKRVDRRFTISLILAVVVMIASCVFQPPAMALTSFATPTPFAARIMSKDLSASAKQAEGRLEAAHGELTGDAGEKLKGQAKQVQAAAMQAGSDLKEGVKSTANKVSDATAKAADKIK